MGLITRGHNKQLFLSVFSFSYAGYTFDHCTNHGSARGPYCLTTVQWIWSKYKIMCFTQNRAYQDCDFSYNNGINTCGNPSGALNPCFIKKTLIHPLSQKVLLFWGVLPGGDLALKGIQRSNLMGQGIHRMIIRHSLMRRVPFHSGRFEQV